MTSPATSDKLLFTPGPLTTSPGVKQAMLRDLGSRDEEFIELVADIRTRLLALGGVSREAGFEAVLMQGSGTFGLESVISSVVPREGRLLVCINGAYGRRIATVAERHQIRVDCLEGPEDESVAPETVRDFLQAHPDVTHVFLVHCETTTGILNPLESVGSVVRGAGRVFLVDAMSSFGGVPMNLETASVDFLVSSSNKCIQGVPGFSFVLARRVELEKARGGARTLSLDLHAQWRGLEDNGQFRFTPPTHALLAFHQALQELEAEGGVGTRHQRYNANQRRLVEGMKRLGFEPYLRPGLQGPIITTFRYPDRPDFDFQQFYRQLSERGLVIYPGKLTEVNCFRIGTIGELGAREIDLLLAAVGDIR